MDVLLMICHHLFSDAKEPSTMFKLKRNIQGIFEQLPDEQQLCKANQFLVACKMLGKCGFTSQRAWPQAPATVGLAFWADDAFGALHVEPFSSPLELPDVMKQQDLGSSTHE
ncbi:elongin-B-like [Lepus europaeus]|uniref:elongin-B-like n=1 Tax=Lepus europaeus TaxID=9983 RepID=UPI002B493675|nr:elongin-B-like [Lepus europaeus]